MAIFNSVKGLQPKRHFFDLSFDKKFTCDMGQLIPLAVQECVPGDNFKLSVESIVRFQPLIAPVLHEINVYVEAFFVPTRLLWSDWEAFITGGVDGQDSHTLPLWTDYKTTAAAKYTLWDYMGFPLVAMTEDDNCPISFPRSAYNLIWNTYYRDENIDTEISLSNNDILYRRWKKDYFTSALPWRQRGGNVGLPLYGTAPVSGDLLFQKETNYTLNDVFSSGGSLKVRQGNNNTIPSSGHGVGFVFTANEGNYSSFVGRKFVMTDNTTLLGQGSNSLSFQNGTADLTNVTAGDISDLRLAFQLQKWMERNARCGVRYPEFTLAHFGVSPADSRLQRPEYIGGTKAPLLISEVLQTSETSATSPQGNLSGRGIGVSGDYLGKYVCPEFGYIITLFSIMPKNGYNAQGVNKTFLRRSRYDFYFPEFAHLSEQPVQNKEIFVSGVKATDNATFGYQGIYDEMRHNRGYVCADMRDTFNYWHLNKIYATTPALNSSFLECKPSKRIFAVQNEPGFVCDVGNVIKAVRPIPKYADPGFMDHF